MHFIGLDVHKSLIAMSVVKEGLEMMSCRLSCQRERLVEAVRAVSKPRTVVLEEGTQADWCRRALLPWAKKVIVSDPRWNRIISESEHKDDPVDAFRLAWLGYMGQLREVFHGRPEMQKLKEAVQAYWQATEDLVRAKNRLQDLFLRRGLLVGAEVYRKSGYERRRQELQRRWGETHWPDQIFEQVELFQRQQGERLQYLKQRVKAGNLGGRLKALETIPGFGPVVAATFLAVIGNPWRFPNKRKMWKYCGLAQSRRTSAGRRRGRQGRSLQYNRTLRHVLGLAAAAALRCRSENSLQVQAQLMRSQNRREGAIHRHLCRRLAVVAWTIMKTGESFRG